MHGLTQEQINDIPNWNGVKLLNIFERYSDRKYIIGLQNASGVAHKDESDSDVLALHDSCDILEKEVLKRAPGKANRDLLRGLEADSNYIAHDSAWRTRALGIPNNGKNDSEIQQIKDDFMTKREQLESKLKD